MKTGNATDAAEGPDGSLTSGPNRALLRLMKGFLQWVLLSGCVIAIYCNAYGRRGLSIAIFFILCIGAFLWLLNRLGKRKGE